jgi:hypothetical protein
MSRYLNGASSKLVSDPRNFDDPGIIGSWSQEQLVTMNDRFVARVEWAFRRGLESRRSAGANGRPHAGDRDRLPRIA